MIKTKKIVYLLALLPLWAGMAACTSDDITEAKPAKETLIVQGGNIEFNANQEGAEVPVTADCHWVMTYDKGTWTDLTVQPHQGNGNGTLVIRSGQNTTTQPRTATLLLTRILSPFGVTFVERMQLLGAGTAAIAGTAAAVEKTVHAAIANIIAFRFFIILSPLPASGRPVFVLHKHL